VHRLDKETSGLVVFTRSWLAKKTLTSAFRAHAVHRRYLAIVHGIAREGTIRSHLVPNRGDGLRGSVERRRGRARALPGEKTQLAVTHVTVEERFDEVGASLVACRLETGRTHQIRIHLAESGHPLLGERVYIRGWPGTPIAAPRLMLHAAELGFVHPATHREMRWTSPLPADMRETLESLRPIGEERVRSKP
jgi:23S rRNA pseudouridine1911/1915/1917 synthase